MQLGLDFKVENDLKNYFPLGRAGCSRKKLDFRCDEVIQQRSSFPVAFSEKLRSPAKNPPLSEPFEHDPQRPFQSGNSMGWCARSIRDVP
jgi:hypothetical protein